MPPTRDPQHLHRTQGSSKLDAHPDGLEIPLNVASLPKDHTQCFVTVLGDQKGSLTLLPVPSLST